MRIYSWKPRQENVCARPEEDLDSESRVALRLAQESPGTSPATQRLLLISTPVPHRVGHVTPPHWGATLKQMCPRVFGKI